MNSLLPREETKSKVAWEDEDIKFQVATDIYLIYMFDKTNCSPLHQYQAVVNKQLNVIDA